jgi:hypothetical protein
MVKITSRTVHFQAPSAWRAACVLSGKLDESGFFGSLAEAFWPYQQKEKEGEGAFI